MGPHPAVAQARLAVRRCLAEFPAGAVVLAACSGGSDSLALAAALAHEAPRQGLRGGGVTIDHGLQPGSAGRARSVADILAGLGLDPVCALAVTVTGAAGLGPEAAARTARYDGLDQAVHQTGAAAVLLGHTRDDQAETVLLGLARGAGPRSLSGMPASRGHYRRPLLGLSRSTLRTVCDVLGLSVWDDPHNSDFSMTRARVRHQALPALEATLGPGVAEALARTADLLRADTALLDELAAAAAERAHAEDGDWDAEVIAELPAALRTRVLRQAAIAAGCPPGGLTAGHVGALDRLLAVRRGQRWADLPGGLRGMVHCGRLRFAAGGPAGTGGPAGPDGHAGQAEAGG